MLSIQGPTNFLKRVIFGPKTYLVPRDDGLIIVGATVEKDSKFNQGNTPNGIKQLQEGIRSLLPEAINWPQMEHWWGFRPCTPDLKPIIGKSKFEIDLWFNEEELCEWENSDSKWRSEN